MVAIPMAVMEASQETQTDLEEREEPKSRGVMVVKVLHTAGRPLALMGSGLLAVILLTPCRTLFREEEEEAVIMVVVVVVIWEVVVVVGLRL
jgi:hypothetical protein